MIIFISANALIGKKTRSVIKHSIFLVVDNIRCSDLVCYRVRGIKIDMVAKINSPRVEIHYCTQCRFILRANWMAQELLMTFTDKIGELALIPAAEGVFTVILDGEEIFSRKKQGRFPESKELKQLIRDRIEPNMPLGHSDT